ncbi:MAG TPA: hypothetical protein VMY05_02435 [Acidobacteriota bacterium]|nr:hypothetical protein [Acidobacteriota bacterium]
MDGIGNDRRDLVRAIYEQHCSQARHADNLRVYFAIVFVFLCAGALAVNGGALFNAANRPLVGFLAVIALFGFFLCLGLESVARGHLGAAELILSRYGLEHYSAAQKSGASGRLFGLSRLVPLLFLFCFSFLLFILIQIGLHNVWKSAPVPVLVLIIGAAFTIRGRDGRTEQVQQS